MNRKIFCWLLVLALSLPLLTACNGNEGGDTTEGTTTEESTTVPRFDYMDADVANDVTISAEAYKNLTLTVPNSYKVTDDDVTDYIDNIRFQYREAVNGTALVTDLPLSMGDDAYIFYKGFLDGKEFEGGSNWDDESPHKLGLGSGSFIPGFEEGLCGIVPSQTSKENPAKINVTFPADYPAEDLAGKAVVFHVAVGYAVQYTMKDYNRDFVENVLKYEPKEASYENDDALLREFEAYVRDHLVKQRAEDLETAKTDALWNHLLDSAECQNLPADELAYYYDSYESEIAYYYNYYMSSGGESFAALYPDLDSFAVVYMGLDKGADWKAELQKAAESMVKKHMIAHAVAELEGIEVVTDAEFAAQVQIYVDYYQGYMTKDEILANMGEAMFMEAAFTEKMDAWLMGQVTFTFEDGTPLVSVTE